MTTTLDVVNECLATMGESPLNALAEPHEFKAPILRVLSKADKHIQSRGWWYNSEELTLTPDPVNSQMTLPGDCLRAESGIRLMHTLVRGAQKPWIIQRGRRMYDTSKGTYTITEDLAITMVRQIPIEELPTPIGDYIAAETVLKFQSNYDGDNNRRQELAMALKIAMSDAISEDVRQRRVNMLSMNATLGRIKSLTRSSRYNLGR
jgi:hypothetical protein